METPLKNRIIVLRALRDLRLLNLECEYVELRANEVVRYSLAEAILFLAQGQLNQRTGVADLKTETPLPIWPGTMVWWEDQGNLVGPGLVIGEATDHDEVQKWYLAIYNEKGYLLPERAILEHHPHHIVRALRDVLMSKTRTEKQFEIIRSVIDSFTQHIDADESDCSPGSDL